MRRPHYMQWVQLLCAIPLLLITLGKKRALSALCIQGLGCKVLL
jgi:hypothetical protein